MLAVVLLSLLPAMVRCAGDGNIRLMEEEVATAMKACVQPENKDASATPPPQRKRRSEDYPKIDNNDNTSQNLYSHERRNTSDHHDQMYVVNSTDDWTGREYNTSESYMNRTRRSDPLLNKPDTDQCLSQCIFANLQVVDSRGIPREAELWSKVQSAVTSQQSRAALRDQIRACFQELQSEAEDNGCSYSNKLERCLMLRFSDRKDGGTQTTQKP